MNTEQLLLANTVWAEKRRASDPEFFSRLAAGQSPVALWIGCADSRVPPDHIFAADPGTLFVHRNVANLVSSGDLSLMTVLEYAAAHLKVADIYVCGHESCGGVAAALDGPPAGVLSHWLSPVRQLMHQHAAELDSLSDRGARVARLVELNVRHQVETTASSPVVQAAWARGQSLTVRGLVFHLSTGKIQDLDCARTGPQS